MYIRNTLQASSSIEPGIYTFSLPSMSAEHVLSLAQQPEFRKYGNIPKDICQVCRDCEHRYMCLDSRIPKEAADGSWYFEKECMYNPYICKWKDEDGYYDLKTSGVTTGEHGIGVEKQKIQHIVKELWC